jgi:predicted AlkP superfamily phosphohydrolase/phosphomutase
MSDNAKKYRKVVLLGMDGLDPRILSALMGRDELPNFQRLKGAGSFMSLATSNPAQSPVAWASIATGNNPGYHGIFDFLSRRVTDYMPELAITRPNPKNVFGKREQMFLPVMHGNAFWDYTSEAGIPSVVLKWPMTFQPKQNKTRLYAGLGVPDIKGGLGKYTFYSTRDVPKSEEGHEKVIKVRIDGGTIRTSISGPNITKLMSRDAATTDLIIKLTNDSRVEMNVAGKTFVLDVGRWSEWIEVKFKLGMMKSASGIVKFFLNSINPEFELYMTPVQINPKEPAFVITSPDNYIQELSGALGLFYTLGMSEDTKALEEGRIDDDTFIQMCDEIVDEQAQMLWHEMNRFREGLLAFAFFSTDRIQHMFWAARDPEHPLYNEQYAKRYGTVIDDYYRKMDGILGQLLADIDDDDTALMVFSDHGFSTFRRAVHLNSWLVQNGLMTLTKKVPDDEKEGGALFQYVDWKRTSAYALGFGSIYLNLKGRERNGIVEPHQADTVLDKVVSELKELTDIKNGRKAVKEVYKSQDIYSGDQAASAPDLVVGFNDGFRASWQTAIGGAPAVLIEDNLKKWSGDHIVDASLVPGILLANFPINKPEPHQIDIAPTVLNFFGLDVQDMEGDSLL